jgi:hypothetical protein
VTEIDGDRVLWRGEPEKYFFIERSDWLVMVIGVAWVVLNVWLIADYLNERTFLSAVRVEWRIVSLLIGTALTLGHPVARAIALLNTRYTITENAVIVEVGGLRPRMNARTFDMLLPPVVQEHGDGVGSIAFGEFPRPVDTIAAVVGRRSSAPLIVLRRIWPISEVLNLITSKHERAWATTQ